MIIVKAPTRNGDDLTAHLLRRIGAGLVIAPMVVLVGWMAAGVSLRDAAVALLLMTIGLALLVAIMRRPEIGALVTFVLVACVPVDTLFQYDIPVLSGGLKVTDVLLLVSLGAWLIRRMSDERPLQLPSRAVTGLLLAFVASGVLAVFTARSSGVQLKFSLLELRGVIALLLVFPIVDGVRRRSDAERGVVVFLIAVATGSVVIIRDFLSGRGGVSLFSADAVRINDLLYLYPLAGLVWVVALLSSARKRGLRMVLFVLGGLSAAALYFTFRRGAWAVALLVPIGVFVLLPRHRRGRLGRALLLMTAAIVLVIAIANSFSSTPIKSPLDSGKKRLFSLGSTGDDVSTRHRLAELKEARRLILRHPLTGIGLGATITFVSPLYNQQAQSSDVPETNIYLHDSYEWVAVKLGLPAFVAFLLMLGAVSRDAYRGYSRIGDLRSRQLMLGGLVTILALVAVSFSEPHLTYVGSSPLFAAAIALTQVVPQLPEAEPALR